MAMKRKLQFAGWLMALGLSAALAGPSLAQNRPAPKPPKPQPQRQAQNQQGRQQQQARRAQNGRQNSGSGANRPPNANMNRAATAARPNNNPNRPPSAYTPPARKFNELSPQEQKKVVENYNKQKNLTPAQIPEINDRIKTWQNLTPEQRNHIKNDVVPKWKQLPPDRQRAISQRLGVLKNMPASARNQHLNDPNFTRGMSEEDKATLKDLSHMHVGGPPEPPSE
jgi:hypothetical protein